MAKRVELNDISGTTFSCGAANVIQSRCRYLALLLPLLLLRQGVGKTCVETEEADVFFCSDDGRKTRQMARKTAQYYLNNFGVKQTMEGSTSENEAMKGIVEKMELYFASHILTDGRFDESLMEKCANSNAMCVFWASLGECDSNPGYMKKECILACRSCEQLLPS